MASISGSLQNSVDLKFKHNPNDQTALSFDSFPVIDFKALSAADPGQRSKGIHELNIACEEWGFFILVNHGVPEEMMDATFSVVKEFMSLDEDEKKQYAGKIGVDPLQYVGLDMSGITDLAFKFWRERLWIDLHPKFHCPNNPKSFRRLRKVIGFPYRAAVQSAAKTSLMKEMVKSQTRLISHVAIVSNDIMLSASEIKELVIQIIIQKDIGSAKNHVNRFDECGVSSLTVRALTEAGYVQMTRVQEANEFNEKFKQVSGKLMEAISDGLQLEHHYVDQALGFDSSYQFVAANYYPPCPQPDKAIGIVSHTDIGLFTLLIHNGVPGLQIEHQSQWFNVDSPKDSIVFNVSDQLEIFSNGRYKSLTHRVVVNAEKERMSIALQCCPSKETIVAPAAALLEKDGNRAMYRSVKFGDFIERLFNNREDLSTYKQ